MCDTLEKRWNVKVCSWLLQKSSNCIKKLYCNKVIDNYPHVLEFVPECCKIKKVCDKSVPEFYKIKKVCDKSVNTYPSAMKFVLECLMTQEMCDKTVNRCFFVFY